MEVLLLLWVALAAAVAAMQPNSHERTICDLCACTSGTILCQCTPKTKEITIQEKGQDSVPRQTGSITIRNCQYVKISSRSINGILPLRRVVLENISLLVLDRESFLWQTTKILDSYPEPGIDITITNSTISVIPSEVFQGHLNTVTLKKVKINEVKPLAFANIGKMEKIEFTDCDIQGFSQKAFNKLLLESLTIQGGYIGTLPSNTMNSLEIYNYLGFKEVNFGTIRSSAFKITETSSFKLSLCKIGVLEGEAFQIKTKGHIVIDDNIIDNIHEGAFLGIQHDPMDVTEKELVFENNTLTKFEDGALALNSSGLKITIDRIRINLPCDCSQTKRWSTKLVRYTHQPTSMSKLMWCQRGKIESGLNEFEIKHCSTHPSKIPLVLSIIIGTLVSLICLCSIGFWLYKKHFQQYTSVSTRENNRLSSHSGNHMIVLPDRVYKETEIYVMTESVEPIKEESPPQVITKSAQ